MKITPDTIRSKISEMSISLLEIEDEIGELELTVKILQEKIGIDQAPNR